MDYTTLTIVKTVLNNTTETTDDTLLARLITAVSRSIDRYVTGVNSGSDNYFLSEAVAGEVIRGQVDAQGRVVCYPHKSQINSIASLQYRRSPADTWTAAALSRIEIDGPTVRAWEYAGAYRGALSVAVSYNGGHATATAGLPADLVESATALAVRYYNEDRAGLADIIGVDQSGTLMYSKAWPLRVKEALNSYRRVIAW